MKFRPYGGDYEAHYATVTALRNHSSHKYIDVPHNKNLVEVHPTRFDSKHFTGLYF